MKLIDTHAHLYAQQFDPDLIEVIQRAKENKISKIFLPNIDLDSIGPLNQLVKNHKDLFIPMMGLHPCSVGSNYREVLPEIEQELDRNNHYVAVGEIGINLYWDKTFLKEQQDAFEIQIRWAKSRNLPIVIHCRDSFDEIYEILKAENDENLNGILHCFGGSLSEGEKIIDLGGFYLGIGGVITFKNTGLKNVVKELPLSKLVIETDAPYLTPAPHRGKRNESSYVKYIAQEIAQVKEITLEEVAQITTANALSVFKQ